MILKAPSSDIMNNVLAAYSYDDTPNDTAIGNVLRQSAELIARIAGWCAHRVEELVSGQKIICPAYKNLTQHQPYIPIEDR
jgi:hypothetical protein